MGFLKNLFKKKEVLESESKKQELITIRDGYPVCEKCGLTIGKEQKIKTFNGKKFHLKPCWRNVMKEAKQTAFI